MDEADKRKIRKGNLPEFQNISRKQNILRKWQEREMKFRNYNIANQARGMS
jgi:hypothetical protein